MPVLEHQQVVPTEVQLRRSNGLASVWNKFMSHANLLVEDTQALHKEMNFSPENIAENSTADSSSEPEKQLMERESVHTKLLGRYFKILRIHSLGVIVYWVCTVSMLIESFVLFIEAVAPSGLNFRHKNEHFKSQEIAEFILACCQLVCMSLGIAYRVQLAQRHSRKTIWAFTAFMLSLLMLGLSINDIKAPR